MISEEKLSERDWSLIRRVHREAFRSSLHFAIASADPEGRPHVTPIGSLLLGPPHGVIQ